MPTTAMTIGHIAIVLISIPILKAAAPRWHHHRRLGILCAQLAGMATLPLESASQFPAQGQPINPPLRATHTAIGIQRELCALSKTGQDHKVQNRLGGNPLNLFFLLNDMINLEVS